VVVDLQRVDPNHLTEVRELAAVDDAAPERGHRRVRRDGGGREHAGTLGCGGAGFRVRVGPFLWHEQGMVSVVTQTTVFEVVGGQPFFDGLIERFSARVESDPELRRVYPDDIDAGMQALALFLAQYWGGPSTYSEQKGHPRLRMRHAPFAI